MTLERFENEYLRNNNGVMISKKYNIWNDYELTDLETWDETQYNSLQELVDENPEVKKIIEEAEDFLLQLD